MKIENKMKESKFEHILKITAHLLKTPAKNMCYNHGNAQEYNQLNCERWEVPYIPEFVDCDTYLTSTRYRVQGYFPFKTPDDLINLSEEQLKYLANCLPDEPASFGNHVASDEEGYYVCIFSG